MRGKHRLWAVLGLVLLASVAASAARALTLQAGELDLAVGVAWQWVDPPRNSPDYVALRWGEGPEVFLLKRQTVLKTTPENFFLQLERAWLARYGDQAVLTWKEIAGTRWRVCRRPSLEGPGVLFQLVTLRGTQAYQLVVRAAPGVTELPDPVVSLLGQVSWDGRPMPGREALAAGGGRLTAGTEFDAAGFADAVAAATDEESLARPPSPGVQPWRLLRVVVAPGRHGDWDATVGVELHRLGSGARLKGLGVQAHATGLDWFLDGESASTEGGAVKRRYAIHWRAEWQLPPDSLAPGGDFPINLRFDRTAEDDAGFGVRYGWFGLCAPQDAVVAWLNVLEQGKEDYSRRVGGFVAGCRPNPVEAPAAQLIFAGGDGANATAKLPAAWLNGVLPGDADAVRRVALVMRFVASEAGTSPGDALLAPVAIIYVYGPDE